MANLYRLICALVLMMAPALVHAAFPPTTGQAWYANYNGNHYRGITAPAACGAAGNAHSDPFTGMDGPYCRYQRAGRGVVELRDEQICPANSVLVGGSCVCEAGFDEQGSQCVRPPDTQCEGGRERDSSGQCTCKAGTKEPPGGIGACLPDGKDPVCGPLAGQGLGIPYTATYGSTSTAALGRMIGKPSSSCFPGGCALSGTVSDCYSAGGVASCNLSNVAFTGEKCDDKAQPSSCPDGTKPSEFAVGVCVPVDSNCAAGSTPSKYASGVCIPDENPCPAGQSPSKYAQGVCVPNESNDASGNNETGRPSNCPKGQVPSKYAQGVCLPADTTVTGSGGAGTTCKDGKCTTTTPGTGADDKPQDAFCKENPESPLCKKSTFGGSCSAGWSCDGDAAMCALAKEQHKRNCELFSPDTDKSSTYGKAVSGTDEKSADALRAAAVQTSVGAFNQSGYGWQRSCPVDPEFLLPWTDGKSLTLPFSRLCGPLGVLANVGVVLTLVASMVYVVGVGKQKE